MAAYSCTLGNLLRVDSGTCAIGPNSSTTGTYNTFVGAGAGSSATSNTSNAVAIGSGANVGSSSTDVVAVGANCTVGASANTICLGNGAFGNTANTFVMGSSANPLIPVAYYSPFTHYRTIFSYTASKSFYSTGTDATTIATPLVYGILMFNISSSITVTLPSSASVLAQLHDYVSGSYVWGYMCNTNTGYASITIRNPSGTNYYGPSSLTAGNGLRFVMKVNGSAIDYIM